MTGAPSGPWVANHATLDDLIAGRLPDENGRYGEFGGRFVPETLMPALRRLEEGTKAAFADPGFQKAFGDELVNWSGRPTPSHTRRD